jgi:hypothetical protein
MCMYKYLFRFIKGKEIWKFKLIQVFVMQVELFAQWGPFKSVLSEVNKHMIANSLVEDLCVKHEKRVLPEEKDLIRACGVLNFNNAMELCRVVYYVYGYELGLRGCGEHVNAKWSDFNYCSKTDSLTYTFPPDKTQKGSCKKPHAWVPVTMHRNHQFPDECPVALYLELQKRRPENSDDRLYLQPNHSGSQSKGNFRRLDNFTRGPLGKAMIGQFMHQICEAARIQDRAGQSLRRTFVSDMVLSGVPVRLFIYSFIFVLF